MPIYLNYYLFGAAGPIYHCLEGGISVLSFSRLEFQGPNVGLRCIAHNVALLRLSFSYFY